ncbi:MAG: hypothetical protein HFJ38_05850 [Bacilli bacterium]|nr:hypothetical protein [Bacilli bacterium]
MNDYKLTLLIMKNTAKLERMIKTGADYSKILRQSEKLDYYIVEKMKNQILYKRNQMRC